eukprot:scaffold7851_cov60-Phaeocystis_antarctica.AAC.1
MREPVVCRVALLCRRRNAAAAAAAAAALGAPCGLQRSLLWWEATGEVRGEGGGGGLEQLLEQCDRMLGTLAVERGGGWRGGRAATTAATGLTGHYGFGQLRHLIAASLLC